MSKSDRSDESGLIEPIQTLAIVDSRNMAHQAERLLGFRQTPTVDGVIKALAPYGFDVTAVHIGLALPRDSDRSRLAEIDAENRAYKSQIEKHKLGKVLLGELHVKDHSVEEKQVDVAVAVDLARHATEMARGGSRFKAIVVVSQDSDLRPAYRYAIDELGIPLVIAAADVVNHRGEPFVLLGEPAMANMCEIPEAFYGHKLRARVANCAKDRRREEWECLAWDGHRRGYLLRNADGVLGIVARNDVPRGFDRGSRLELYAHDVDFSGPMFPVVRCAPNKPAGPNDLRTGKVVARWAASTVKVEMANGTTEHLYCPPGFVRPGTEVLVQEASPRRLVGALSPPPECVGPHGDVVASGEALVVRVSGAVRSTLSVGVRPGVGRVAIAHSKADAPSVGDLYAVVLSDEPAVGEKGRWPLAHLVSSRLPGR